MNESLPLQETQTNLIPPAEERDPPFHPYIALLFHLLSPVYLLSFLCSPSSHYGPRLLINALLLTAASIWAASDQFRMQDR